MSSRASWWTSSHGTALKLAIARYGSQAKLLGEIDLSRSSVIEILAGRSAPKRETLDAICTVIGVDTDEFIDAASEIEAASPSSSVAVPEIDLAYGMGGTFVDDISVSEVVRDLPMDWIRQFTRAQPSELFLCRGIGDSMMPTLLDSDVLLVDRSQDTLKQSDRVWVVMVGEVGMVKRVRVQPGGNLLILSDNENVPPMEAVDGEAVLIGRVVAVIRKM